MKFSPIDALKVGWETFKRRPWFFVGATVVMAILYTIASLITAGIDVALGGSSEDPTLAGSLVNYALGALISMGVTAFFLSAHDNPEATQLSQLWHPQPFWKYLGTSILVTVAMVIGFVLLIVPGFIAMVLFMFSTFIVIDRGLGPIDAMKESMRITEGNRWALFGFILLVMLAVFVGALALGVGLLVAVPVSMLAMVHAYRFLSAHAVRIAPPDVQLET